MNKQLKIESAKQLSFLSEIGLPSYPLTLLSSFKRTAFTLAETLIVLVVIGVVAVLTVPALVENYQKQVTIAKLKTDYSIFSQAIKQSIAENGDIIDWNHDLKTIDFTAKYILPYINDVSVCEKKSKSCKSYNLTTFANSYYLYWSNTSTTDPHYLLKNGTRFFISKGGVSGEYCLVIDLNNSSKPNVMGKDGFVFAISINKNGILPSGAGNTRDNLLNDHYKACSKTNSWYNVHYAGEYCAALIMLDGWQISEDYPWK